MNMNSIIKGVVMKDPYKIENKVLSDLIDSVYEIIKDYRAGEYDCMQKTHIITWINQFDSEDDRILVMSELLHLLPESYLSKEKTLEQLVNFLKDLRDEYSLNSVEDLLAKSCFVKIQDEGKSQISLIDILDEYTQKEFNIVLNTDIDEIYDYYIYIDDILATGGTLYREIVQLLEEYPHINSMKSTLIFYYNCIHYWGYTKKMNALNKENKAPQNYAFFYDYTIENNLKIDESSQNHKFNFIYPLYSDEGEEFLNNIDNYVTLDNRFNKDLAFRDATLPTEETYFSSSENRVKYENILLKKGIEIMNNTKSIGNDCARPLGYTPKSYQTLGTGTHFFTWRNISNTCPLVFWYSGGGWSPLFKKRKN